MVSFGFLVKIEGWVRMIISLCVENFRDIQDQAIEASQIRASSRSRAEGSLRGAEINHADNFIFPIHEIAENIAD